MCRSPPHGFALSEEPTTYAYIVSSYTYLTYRHIILLHPIRNQPDPNVSVNIDEEGGSLLVPISTASLR